MAIDLSKKDSVQPDLYEAGSYPARLIRIIEVGKHTTKYGDKDQVIFGFSTPTELMDVKQEDGSTVQKQRMIWSKALTISTNEKSSISEWMLAINKNALTYEDVITLPCLIEINQYKSEKNGNTYNSITSVSSPMKGLEVAFPDTDTYIFDFTTPDMEVWAKLSEYRQAQITSSIGFEDSALAKLGVVAKPKDDTK